MTVVEWGSFWLGVAAVPVVGAIAVVLGAAVLRAINKNLGIGACLVCDEGFACDIGDYTRLGIWLRSRKHQWVLRNKRAHRDAWARHRWNPYRLPGYFDDDSTQAAVRRPRPNLIVRIWWAIAD